MSEDYTRDLIERLKDKAHGKDGLVASRRPVLANSVLIVDDSPDIRRALRRLLDSEPSLKVSGEAVNGKRWNRKSAAIEAGRNRPGYVDARNGRVGGR